MDKVKIEKYKKILLEKRKEMVEHMESIKESDMNKTTKEASGDHSSYSFHMADQGTDNMEREKSFFYAQRDGRLIYHIDKALDRIADGSYGKCHVCGEYVSDARLEAVPHARMCIACKSQEEKGRPYAANAGGK